MESLKKRILDISYRHKLSHIGSNLTALPIIHKIYEKKKNHEPFILSSGHSGLALYVELEHKYGYDAEELFKTHGVHPNRDMEHKIWCSTGSLGHGLPIAVGMALADRSKTVYVVTSDGELSEGSMYEAARNIYDHRIGNLSIHINYNGWGAYRRTSIKEVLNFTRVIDGICEVKIHNAERSDYPFLTGQSAHYYVMTKEDYEQITGSIH